MTIGRLLMIATSLCAVAALTTDADAAKKKRTMAKDLVVVSGCARFVPPFCTAVAYRGTTYIVNSANPHIPRDTGVTVIGRKTGDMSPCFGTWLQVISWKPNRLLCTQR